MKNALSLYELNQIVHEVIETTLDKEYWVEAEISEVREVRGHCYMELIQKDIFNNTPVARASAKCWKNTWIQLRPNFENITGQIIHSGMKVLLKVFANFHEAYGFSWIVTDIDPTYTLGDMAFKRQEIINRLKEEGVYDLQKSLTIPVFAQRIAVISNEHAAGYGDFMNQLHNNEYNLVFYPTLFSAIMQGEKVEQSVIAALNQIYEQIERYDLVVIIRGGGASADLSGFDTLSLAENVANFPLPIITGIGHERDESILDLVSHTRVKTPTAAASFLIDHLLNVYNQIEDYQMSIAKMIEKRMFIERMRLERLSDKIPVIFSVYKTRQESRFDSIMNMLKYAAIKRLTKEEHNIEVIERSIPPTLRRILINQQHLLNLFEQKVEAANPEKQLKRGFSITTHKGKVVRDSSMLKLGDEIETRVNKGVIKSTVSKI